MKGVDGYNPDKAAMYSKQIKFLKDLGCDKKSHTQRSLLDHLRCTQLILELWRAPKYLQDAGLFHSIYGTPVFKHQSTDDRDAVRELIGEQAEEVVYHFCQIEQPRLENINKLHTGRLRGDLLILTRANFIENRKKFKPGGIDGVYSVR
jgi:hypothetical protein